MRTALIGYTGFVGSNLAKQYTFTELYNSQNISEVIGQKYDLVVCAAAPGQKWKANQNPQEDWQSISRLLEHLTKLTTKEFVLISTVDVYPVPPVGDELTEINPEQLQPYGKHRLELEKKVQQLFPKTTICRLPALFGPGLKKNFIFDLINDRLLDFTHPDSEFQFYDIRNLWKDIKHARALGIPLINLVTEPLSAGKIAKTSLNLDLKPGPEARPIKYDLHTRYANKNYIASEREVLSALVTFITESKKQATQS